MAKRGFLSALKNKLGGESEFADTDDSDMDLEAGIIRIDDSAPTKIVSTSDVLDEENSWSSGAPSGAGGHIFVVDLNPFFKAMQATSESRIAKSLITFSETLIGRTLEGRGTFRLVGTDKFFLRLNVPDSEGWSEAANIVNDIGVNFLRDAFNPEVFLPRVLSAVDPENAFDADGNFSAKNAWNARKFPEPETAAEKKLGAEWKPFSALDDGEAVFPPPTREWEGKDIEAPPTDKPKWTAEEIKTRAARMLTERGPERRAKKLKVKSGERRKRPYGRRDSDNPNRSVW